MNVRRAWVQTGGLCAILSALCFIGTQATNMLLGGNRLLYGWLGLLGSVLMVPMTVGFYHFLREEGAPFPLQMGSVSMITSVPFLCVFYGLAFAAHAVEPHLAGASAQATAAVQHLLDGYRAAYDLANSVSVILGVLLSFTIATTLIALASLRVRTVPRWLSWMGIITGLWGLLWLGYAFATLFLIIASIGMFLAMIWQIIMGVIMLRQRELPS